MPRTNQRNAEPAAENQGDQEFAADPSLVIL
jgi:hypothetical protein